MASVILIGLAVLALILGYGFVALVLLILGVVLAVANR